ncbi:TPA: hypothetical protein N0F65_000599 [Lagenidium giganteum]|uniref:UBA domain-containing protein n=1 Tax=Lagenidium giganteum TaxID=4803 RepID=A0AAV2YJN3_9STRA|nr:TPA: hypothetical protein N0F65_000599 [Lagenidium giganteum]
MTTLKILWKEKQDMRRVQAAAANQALVELDGRAIADANSMRYNDLRDYVLLVFPELKAMQRDVFLYYTDDDDEQVRVTNDVELDEAFRLMEELARAAGKGVESAVCKITVLTRPRAQPIAEEEQSFLGNRQKKMMELFVDMSKLLDKWAEAPQHQELKKDLASLLHEPGCQEALLQIMSNPKFATVFESVAEEFRKGGNFSSSLTTIAQNGELEEIAGILLQKCPQARTQIERVMQQLYQHRSAQQLSVSDYFESITVEDTQQETGPILAVFEADVTCPDGTVLAPGMSFDKIWKIRNSGPTRWPEGSKLACVGGDKMQAPDSVVIPSVLPGSSIDVSIRMTAPSKSGRYTGYWRLCMPDGTRFGQRFWVDVNVMAAAAVPQQTSAVRVGAPAPVVRQQSGTSVSIPARAPVVTEQPKTLSDQVRWQTQLRALADMGFNDEAKNIPLLNQHDGDLAAAVSSLL